MRHKRQLINGALLLATVCGLMTFMPATAAPALDARLATPALPEQAEDEQPTGVRNRLAGRGSAITTTIAVTGSTVLTPTQVVTSSTPTSTTPITPARLLTGTESLTGTVAITSGSGLTGTIPGEDVDAALDAAYSDVVEGTIVANRTDANVRFFLEGETFLLDPQRSLGVELPRVTGVLNLYNCDANTPETDLACYWDPYLLNRDGFYEIVAGSAEGLTVNLTLREAGTPPVDQVWIQNRTGQRETIVYRTVTYELAPATVQEFSVVDDALPTFFLRSCVEVDEATACEWAPVVVDPGFYYGLAEQSTTGGLPGSNVTELTLQPVVAAVGEPAAAAVAESTPAQILCSVIVPALNVRSGPGLEYQIVTKIRGTDEESPTVVVVGRNETNEWLAVTDRVADGGWITGSEGYVTCEGEVATLPIAEITDGRLEPTPIPVAVAEEGADEAAPVAEGGDAVADAEVAATEPATPTAAVTVPEGQAVLSVRNDFEQVMRFTIDQKFRPEFGPSEYDLNPGQSVNVAVWPGQVAFSASTPWRGLSGNEDLLVEPNQLRNIKLTFVPDPDGSGSWDLLMWE